MAFPEDTPLEDVLKRVVTATRRPDGKGLPIYRAITPGYQDPFLIEGHCLLAAGFGGFVAPLFSRIRPTAHAAP